MSYNGYAKLYAVIKQITKNYINTMNLTNLEWGTIEAVSPVKVAIDGLLTLGENQIVVPSSFSDYETEITLKGVKEKIIVHNSLKVGERVALMKAQGGQKYIIINRVGD